MVSIDEQRLPGKSPGEAGGRRFETDNSPKSAGNGNGNGNGHAGNGQSGNGQTGNGQTGNGNGRKIGNGNGGSRSYGRPLDLSGWQPVEDRRPAPRVEVKAAEAPAFRHIENGSPRYRVPDQSDPAYSPIAYHFTRVQAHEAGSPWRMWGMVFAVLGICATLLLAISLPAFLTHSAAATPVPTDTTSYATSPVVLATQTPEPTITPTPDPTAVPTPTPVYRHYKVKKGETLAQIAGAYGLKTWEVLAANPILANNAAMLQVGMTLNIPKPGQMKKP